MKIQQSSLLVLALALCLAAFLPLLFMDGMFMDGEMYTAVSHNLALGKGSPWMLYYTDDFHGLNTYHENPPLATWLLAAFFYAFGSSIFIERFYILLTFILLAILINKTWKAFLPSEASSWWLPLFLCISIPVAHWAYRHNMMENTMVLWVLLSILWIKKALDAPTIKWIWLIASALATWAAFMTKGPAGLFPLVAIFAFWLIWRNLSFQKMLLLSFIYATLVLGGIALLFLLPATKEFMENYFFYRTLQRINEIPVVTSRFWILGEWMGQIIIPMLIALFVTILFRKKVGLLQMANKKTFLFFIIIGAAGMLPLMLTKVQRSFYLLTSLPFFTMALAMLILPQIKFLEEQINLKFRRLLNGAGFTVLLITIALTVFLAGEPKRDVEMLTDVDAIGLYLGKDAKIGASKKANYEWSFKAYLMRKHQIQFVDVTKFPEAEYVVAKKDENFSDPQYCKLPLTMQIFELFERCTSQPPNTTSVLP